MHDPYKLVPRIKIEKITWAKMEPRVEALNTKSGRNGLGGELGYTIDPFYWRILVVIPVFGEIDLFGAEVGHDGCVAGCFHFIFIPDYGETTPFFWHGSLCADKLIDDLFDVNTRRRPKTDITHLPITAVFICILKQGHTLLARRTRVRFNDNRLSRSMCIGDGEQIAAGPVKVFRSIIEDFAKEFFGDRGMQMTIT